jgi:hypothetical protein
VLRTEDFEIQSINQFGAALVGKDIDSGGRDDLLIPARGKWSESGEAVLAFGSTIKLRANGAILLADSQEINSFWGRAAR